MLRFKILSVSSLLIFIIVVSTLLGVCGLDLFIQIVSIKDDTSSLTKFLFIVGAACVVLIVVSVGILSARKIRIRSALNQIPRVYVPIRESDMPRFLYSHVQKKLADSASVRLSLKPLSEERHMDGYGRGTDGQLIHFKTAAAKTLLVLSETVASISPSLAHDGLLPLRSYFEILAQTNIPFNPQYAEAYITRYDGFAVNPNEATEFEYLEFMKVFTLLMRSIQQAY
ncbi:hypothetical protein BCR33DRAFT_196655 [Rhizoclosmatium globosum]|uniref:Defect at low temperature protein 1 n=1 Tax=Rhizoclosmatium globosum TaxID=329046 RepID=A0A1Y2CDS9_9FUNG|nr:hypothetical protein BCR33DRAFT_196655 [Rhizoclosmatium globosum]|eukprot:ORY45218.1 hypothetical protein BCR33DRAFT_196655 [Rhizoclosmatium globosum]